MGPQRLVSGFPFDWKLTFTLPRLPKFALIFFFRDPAGGVVVRPAPLVERAQGHSTPELAGDGDRVAVRTVDREPRRLQPQALGGSRGSKPDHDRDEHCGAASSRPSPLPAFLVSAPRHGSPFNRHHSELLSKLGGVSVGASLPGRSGPVNPLRVTIYRDICRAIGRTDDAFIHTALGAPSRLGGADDRAAPLRPRPEASAPRRRPQRDPRPPARAPDARLRDDPGAGGPEPAAAGAQAPALHLPDAPVARGRGTGAGRGGRRQASVRAHGIGDGSRCGSVRSAAAVGPERPGLLSITGFAPRRSGFAPHCSRSLRQATRNRSGGRSTCSSRRRKSLYSILAEE